MNADAVVAAADLHQQDGFGKRIGGVVGIFIDHAQAVLAVFLGPVAGFAGFPGRAQVVDRRRNRPGVSVEGYGKDLSHAGQLAAHEPGRAGTDVAFDALDARMRRLLVGGVLGLHHGVAGLAAEGDRIHVIDGAVAELAGHDDIDRGGEDDEIGQLAELRIAPAERRKGGGPELRPPVGAALPPDAQRNQHQAGKERRRQHHEDQDADVRALGSAP